MDIEKVVMPNVREGSVIELEYTIWSDFLYYLKDWQFQYQIPVAWSEFVAVIPEFYEYNIIYNGYYKLDVNRKEFVDETFQIRWEENAVLGSGVAEKGYFDLKSRSKQYHFASSNIPAFVEEPYMASTSNYIFKIEFELATEKLPGSNLKNYAQTWESVHKELLLDNNFGTEIKKNINSDIVTQIVSESSNDLDKMKTIFSFVKNNYKWNGKNRFFVTNSLNQVVKEKAGSSADINLLLVNYLQQVGLDASPVLISTQNNGVINDIYPGLSKFNYVIAFVSIGNNTYFLDATTPDSQPNLLPLKCYNGKSFLVRSGRFEWIDIQNKNISKKFVAGDYLISETGEIDGSVEIVYTNYFSNEIRSQIKTSGSVMKYIDQFKNKNSYLDISEMSITGYDTIESPLKFKYTATIENQTDKVNDMIYFNPLIHLMNTQNPFKSEERKYLIYFNYPSDETYIVKYTLPEGYSIDQLPKPISLNFLNGSIQFSIIYSQVGNTVQVTCKKKITRTIYTPEEYSGLKETFNQMIIKENEKILIKRFSN